MNNEPKNVKKAILFPGQGSQFRGMGKDLFSKFPEQTRLASEVLGYSIETLCLEDTDNLLGLTQYTQPALFVVNALHYSNLKDTGSYKYNVDFAIGHSLGEYNALLAAEVFDFEVGLKLVQKRGELMGAASGGCMAAVLGIHAEEVKSILLDNQLNSIDLANYNSPTQVVIAGPTQEITDAEKIFLEKDIRYVVLNVSAPFHSRYMKNVKEEFVSFLKEFYFREPRIQVIANSTARPYENGKIIETLGEQIVSSVLWVNSIRYLMGREVTEYYEIGGEILSKMVSEIRATQTPIVEKKEFLEAGGKGQESTISASSGYSLPSTARESEKLSESKGAKENLPFKSELVAENNSGVISATTLGSESFRKRYKLKYAYVSGAMYRGIASARLVVQMGRSGLMGFYGTGGMSLSEIEDNINYIQKNLPSGEAYGMNLLSNYENPQKEIDTVNLYLRCNVRNIEAAAFMQIKPALVIFRLKGLRKDNLGNIVCDNNILAKISRPEVAKAFLSPAPEWIVEKLLATGNVTSEQAELAKYVPMSDDICVEADSGGHTDMGISTVLLPSILRLKEEINKKYHYKNIINVGLAGGIGTPDAAAAAFIMGADFILTGSINQCTVESGISDEVKDMLQDINVQDTEYAPAGDMFETGAKVQVLKKGVFFPARANKLYSLYNHYNSIAELPEKVQQQLQERYFMKTFSEIWEETEEYLVKEGRQNDIRKAESNPKIKMALIFRWYFARSTSYAFAGDEKKRVDYQVHTGPALGAFNQWVKGTSLESWRNRHVDEIGEKLMIGTAEYIVRRFEQLKG